MAILLNTLRRIRFYRFSISLLAVSACTPQPPGIGEPVDWQELRGWHLDNHAEAWTALRQSCKKLTAAVWITLCQTVRTTPSPTNQEAREFFETYFQAHPLYAKGGKTSGLITGYYEPILNGSREPDDRYRYPVYGVPDDLLVIDLKSVYPELKDYRLRGRLSGRRVLPYSDREGIEQNNPKIPAKEILWVDDPIDLFFLQIQGSGRVKLPNGSTVAVAYADQNGHPYRSIGKVLIEAGEMNREAVNLFSLKEWLKTNPDKMNQIFYNNPSYVFFHLKEDISEGPTGSLNVPLTPQRSIAVDRNVIPLGVPVWLETTLPDDRSAEYNRLMLAQDTGGAITGHIRADVFWGHGETAEKYAGLMKQPGRLYVLLPK